MTEPSERAQELASRHEGLNELALMERRSVAALARISVNLDNADESVDDLENRDEHKALVLAHGLGHAHHRFLKGLGTDFFRWLAEHHERTMR